MKATTLQKRIEKHLSTKKGTIALKYEKVIHLLQNPSLTVYPRKWNRKGSHYSLSDKSECYILALTNLSIDYETGYDSPCGGEEGFFIRLTKKGRTQVASFALFSTQK